MIEPQRLERLDLASPRGLQEVTESVNEIVEDLLQPQAFEFLQALQGRLHYLDVQQLGSLAEEYDRLMTALKFVGFVDLAENDAVSLIRNSVVDVFAYPSVSLKEQLRSRLITMTMEERDSF